MIGDLDQNLKKILTTTISKDLDMSAKFVIKNFISELHKSYLSTFLYAIQEENRADYISSSSDPDAIESFIDQLGIKLIFNGINLDELTTILNNHFNTDLKTNSLFNFKNKNLWLINNRTTILFLLKLYETDISLVMLNMKEDTE